MTAVPEAKERPRRRLENRVARYIDSEGLFPPGSGVIVGVSGGPDSTALLLILATIAGRRDVALKAAYFDHQLRGTQAAACEREAVATAADRAGVDLVCGGADVRLLARERKVSLEDAARRARYEFLGRAAEAAGAGFVAVGHTLDDQAETVLLHLIRGAGLAGIAAMAPRSGLPLPGFASLALMRPLLEVTRAETTRYCRDAGLSPVDDESNRSPAYLRNRVRSELMPALRQYNPGVSAALGRLAAAARGDLDFLESEAARLLAAADGPEGLDRELLRSAPAAVRRHAIRQSVVALLGDAQGFSERHWAALERALAGPTGGRLDMPRSVVAEVMPARLRLRLGAASAGRAALEGVAEISVPGETSIGAWRFAAANQPLPGASMVAAVDAAGAGPFLTVRSRRAGDRFQPLGLAGTKKLQDFFTDARVPRAERDAIPVFEAGRGIIWVAGHRIAEWARPTAGQPTIFLSCFHEGTD
jgi:tRNA(Ile)-lysidine synthase